MPESPAYPILPASAAGAEGGRPLRVLHVYRRFHPDYTGDGIYYTRLIPHLEARGIANEVLAYETVTPDGVETGAVEGIPVHYLANRYGEASEIALLRWLAAHLDRFDLVHLHAHVSRSFLAYAFARARGRPVLFSCTLDDSPTQLLAEYKRRNRPLVRLLMRSISTFVVISPHLLRRSLETVPPSRLAFIPQGVALDFAPVTPEDRAGAREALGLAAEDMVLLNVGSVSRRKNIAFLVEALARIPDPAVKLAVVGPLLEDDYVAEIRAIMAREGIEDRVILAGFRNDAARWFTAADAFVFASTAEGFPNVYLEAMARSVPIVSTFLPGLTDFIIDQGRAGFMAADADQFVAAIRHLRADPGLRASMGEAHRGFAERNLELGTVAARYAALYRRGEAGPVPAPLPDLRVSFTRRLSEGPAALGLEEFDTPPDWQPLLQVVIDTEAHFDWHKGIATDFGEVSSITGMEASFDVFRKHGVKPALLIDHPIATQEVSQRIIAKLAAEGCEVGVHLHPWTTPPIVEIKDDWHSFSGNLGTWLERAKLITLTERVAELIGERPKLFKAGRYGLSPNTFDTIEDLGFETDLSICPWYDYSHLGGPDFSRFTSRPGWFGRTRRLLSLPTTAAPLGWLGRRPDPVLRAIQSPLGRRLRLARVAQRVNAFVPRRLSPEGCELADMRAVTWRLRQDKLGVFTLSLHSPTLQVGNTPYVRSEAELQALLRDLDGFLTFFRDEIGGAFTTPSALHARLATLPAGRR
ncbi:glycosyltransferase [Roseomonas sp. AR75]|uniref:glycosyltransferase n=1 Tax=Roseomonas sp. AR75 TaxID=2562311 RepID=UPI001484E2D4|nr:glycosyltransferase [Roseomonas sp. AR75]